MFSIITQYSTLKFSMDSVEIFSRAHIQETVKKNRCHFIEFKRIHFMMFQRLKVQEKMFSKVQLKNWFFDPPKLEYFLKYAGVSFYNLCNISYIFLTLQLYVCFHLVPSKRVNNGLNNTVKKSFIFSKLSSKRILRSSTL